MGFEILQRDASSIGERFGKVKLDAGRWIADTHL